MDDTTTHPRPRHVSCNGTCTRYGPDGTIAGTSWTDCACYVASALRPGITVAITCHPARITNGLLTRALASVLAQTLQPAAILIGNDIDRLGAGDNRARLLAMVDTVWLAWIDSDDEWSDPDHLRKVATVAEQTGAVYVYAGFHGDHAIQSIHFGRPIDPARPHHTTMAVLERTALAQEVGFEPSQPPPYSNEDWSHIKGMAALCDERGLLMVHLAERTWTYHIDGQNSSGLPGQGDAA